MVMVFTGMHLPCTDPEPDVKRRTAAGRASIGPAICVARSGGGALPAEPVDDGAAHHAVEVAALQPRQLLGEHRHALAIRARHAGDVGAPERAVRAEGLEDLLEVAVD